MAEKLRCAKCGEVGSVHVEHVIQGGKSYRACDCRGCGFRWRTLETGEHVPDDDKGRSDHSRPLATDTDAS